MQTREDKEDIIKEIKKNAIDIELTCTRLEQAKAMKQNTLAFRHKIDLITNIHQLILFVKELQK